MYNSQTATNRIKARAKTLNISIAQVLINCGLGKNTISKMANGTDILTQNFAKIADQLDCSVDYLLGRTDVPAPYPKSHIENAFNTIHGNNNVVGNGNAVGDTLSEQEKALLQLYGNLDVIKQAQLLTFAADLAK